MLLLVKLLSLALFGLVLSEATYVPSLYNNGYYYNPYMAQMYQHYLMKGYYPRQPMFHNFLQGKRFTHPSKAMHGKNVEHVQSSMKDSTHFPDPRDALKNPMKAPDHFDRPPINIINMKNHNYPPNQAPSRGPIKIYNVNNHHEAPVIPPEPQNIHIMNIDQEIPAAQGKDIVHTQPNVHIANIDQTHEASEVHTTLEQASTQIVKQHDEGQVSTGSSEEVVIKRMPRNEPAHVVMEQGNIPAESNNRGFVINRLPLPESMQTEQIVQEPIAEEESIQTLPEFSPTPAVGEPISEELTQPDMTGFSEELQRIARQSDIAPPPSE